MQHDCLRCGNATLSDMKFFDGKTHGYLCLACCTLLDQWLKSGRPIRGQASWSVAYMGAIQMPKKDDDKLTFGETFVVGMIGGAILFNFVVSVYLLIR